MVNALRAKGLPVAYVAFLASSMGFVRLRTLNARLTASSTFIHAYSDLELADEVER